MAPKTPAHDPRATTPLGIAALRLGLTPQPLIVLTRDPQLVATLKQVTDAAHKVLPVGSEVDLSGALLNHQGGVAVLDCAAIASSPGQLIDRVHAQFPELVLIVAGGVDEQGMLAAQITSGSVHRFLHKPLSEQRVRLFVEAAWRRHAQGAVLPAAAPAAGSPRRRRPGLAWLALAGALLLAVPLVWRVAQIPQLSPPGAPPPPARSAADDPTLESLLTRADAALAAGSLVAPPHENAAELYRAALQRNARDLRAVNGLEQVIGRLVAAAEGEVQQQRLDAAQRLTEQARAIDPSHARVAFLAAQIAAQRATLAEEARAQLAQQQLDARVADYLNHGREALARGALIAPAEENARSYIESARALAPADAGVQQATRELIDRLESEARQALSAKNAEQADSWIAAAADAGAASAQIKALRQQAALLRNSARADTLAQLAAVFNERLEHGQLLEPASDSAHFYLTQLVQNSPDDPATQRARSAYAARLLDEGRNALRAADFAATRRWLAEARGASADAAGVAALDTALTAAQATAQQAGSYINASALTRTRYIAPQFPDVARARGIDGWVDLQFVVGTDGAVSDVAVVGAEPAGIFEQTALDAVRHWRYQPVVHDGRAVSQGARVRLRFTLQR